MASLARGSASSWRRALLLCLGFCRALTLRGWPSVCLSGLLGCVASVGSCGLLRCSCRAAPVCLLLSWSSALVVSAGLLVALLVGCKVCAVMDRGGLDGLPFERGGLQCAPVSRWLQSPHWSAVFASLLASLACLASVGLRGGRADSLLCFKLATLRGVGWLVFACLLTLASAAPLGSAIHSSSP